MGPADTMQLVALALVIAAAVAAPTTQVQPTFTYGHAAYTYGPLHCTGNPCDVVPSCNRAHWVSDIEAFNNDTSISDAQIRPFTRTAVMSSSGPTGTPRRLAR